MSAKMRLVFKMYLLIFVIMICEIFLSGLTQEFPVKAECLLLVTVFFGLYFGPAYGAEAGLFAGVLKDSAGLAPFGLSALSFLIIGFLCGHIKKRLARETVFAQFFVAFFSSIFYSFAVLACLNIFRETSFIYPLFRRIFYQALVTGIFSAPVFFILGTIFRKTQSEIFVENL